VEELGRTTPFVPPSEHVVIDVRQHPVALAVPVVRLVAGLATVASGLALLPLLVFAATVAVWSRVRLHTGLRGAALAALVAAAALVLLHVRGGAGTATLLTALLVWAVLDVADWWADRLVVSDRRIYRRYGVLTRHSPSIALTAVAFIDAAVPPLGRPLKYGTLRLDSVAQRDAPLSRFDRIPDVVQVHHRVLELRASAMPRFPPLPS
jgi:hypothetical protein